MEGKEKEVSCPDCTCSKCKPKIDYFKEKLVLWFPYFDAGRGCFFKHEFIGTTYQHNETMHVNINGTFFPSKSINNMYATFEEAKAALIERMALETTRIQGLKEEDF